MFQIKCKMCKVCINVHASVVLDVANIRSLKRNAVSYNRIHLVHHLVSRLPTRVSLNDEFQINFDRYKHIPDKMTMMSICQSTFRSSFRLMFIGTEVSLDCGQAVSIRRRFAILNFNDEFISAGCSENL